MDQLDRRLGELCLGPGGQLRLDDIAGHQHRAHPPSARAANIGRDQPLLRRHQANDRAVLTVTPKSANDGWRLASHPRGWK